MPKAKDILYYNKKSLVFRSLLASTFGLVVWLVGTFYWYTEFVRYVAYYDWSDLLVLLFYLGFTYFFGYLFGFGFLMRAFAFRKLIKANEPCLRLTEQGLHILNWSAGNPAYIPKETVSHIEGQGAKRLRLYMHVLPEIDDTLSRLDMFYIKINKMMDEDSLTFHWHLITPNTTQLRADIETMWGTNVTTNYTEDIKKTAGSLMGLFGKL